MQSLSWWVWPPRRCVSFQRLPCPSWSSLCWAVMAGIGCHATVADRQTDRSTEAVMSHMNVLRFPSLSTEAWRVVRWERLMETQSSAPHEYMHILRNGTDAGDVNNIHTCFLSPFPNSYRAAQPGDQNSCPWMSFIASQKSSTDVWFSHGEREKKEKWILDAKCRLQPNQTSNKGPDSSLWLKWNMSLIHFVLTWEGVTCHHCQQDFRWAGLLLVCAWLKQLPQQTSKWYGVALSALMCSCRHWVSMLWCVLCICLFWKMWVLIFFFNSPCWEKLRSVCIN